MNEEKGFLTTIDLGRVSKKVLAFTVSKLQKNESLPHSFFFDCKRSKVIFRVTQRSLRILLNYFRKYLALRGSDHASAKLVSHRIYLSLQNLLTLVANLEVTIQPFRSAPDGQHNCRTVLCLEAQGISHNLKCNCYGK